MARPTVLAERLTAQLLAGSPATTVIDAVQRILAVQAQDPRGARLAIRSRTTGLTVADVDRALTDDRSVVVTTLNRGTLHLVQASDYWWLHALTTPQLRTASGRRLEQEQVSPTQADRAVHVVERALTNDGPLRRDALRERVAAAGIRVDGQALVHILLLAAIRGRIVRGPMVDGEQVFVLVRDWLGRPPPALDHDLALGELSRRYLAGHGPAGEADLAKWAGITLGDARRGFASIAAELVERHAGLAALTTSPDPAALPPPRLLGSFDPSLHGWVSREPILGTSQGIVTTNGVFRPFAMVKGRAVATWTLTRRTVTITPFAPLPGSVATALDQEGAAVVSFLSGGR